jgi:hypothetical protein
MNSIKKFLGAIFYWTYDRGTWQWDISCLVFIIIIFTTPREFFDRYTYNALSPDQIRSAITTFLKNLF